MTYAEADTAYRAAFWVLDTARTAYQARKIDDDAFMTAQRAYDAAYATYEAVRASTADDEIEAYYIAKDAA